MKYLAVGVGHIVCAVALALPASADAPPPDAPQAAAVTNTLSALAQTAAIVEGTVTDIVSEYTEQSGPWTRAELSDVVVHRGTLGSVDSSKVAIRQMGGLFPDGRKLLVSDVPEFIKGKRYVVFLRNTSWRISPIVGEGALRVESSEGKELLVGADGGALTEFSTAGFVWSRPVLPTVESSSAPQPAIAEAQSPVVALGIKEFLAQVDVQLIARRMALTGRFYDLPASRSRIWEVAAP